MKPRDPPWHRVPLVTDPYARRVAFGERTRRRVWALAFESAPDVEEQLAEISATARASDVQILILIGCPTVSDRLWGRLSAFTKLRGITLDLCPELSGEGIEAASTIEFLSLGNTEFCLPAFRALATMPRLASLELSGVHVDDRLITTLGTSKGLRQLVITDPAPRRWAPLLAASSSIERLELVMLSDWRVGDYKTLMSNSRLRTLQRLVPSSGHAIFRSAAEAVSGWRFDAAGLARRQGEPYRTLRTFSPLPESEQIDDDPWVPLESGSWGLRFSASLPGRVEDAFRAILRAADVRRPVAIDFERLPNASDECFTLAAEIPSLKTLKITECETFHGAGLDRLRGLETVWIQSTQLDEITLLAMAKLPQLRNLHLGRIAVSSELLEAVTRSTSLESVTLDEIPAPREWARVFATAPAIRTLFLVTGTDWRADDFADICSRPTYERVGVGWRNEAAIRFAEGSDSWTFEHSVLIRR